MDNPFAIALANMSPEKQRAVRSGHAHFRLPSPPAKELTKNQRKAARRRARGKR